MITDMARFALPRAIGKTTDVIALTFAAVALFAVALPRASRPLLLWNVSASSPRGLYWVSAPARLQTGDTAVAWAPAPSRSLAAERHYLPINVPLVKRVAAASGARVCADGSVVTINGRRRATRRKADLRGRSLPRWSGCHRLQVGELLLLSANGSNAFDGRYFGVTHPNEVIGKARLLWAR